MSRGRAASHSLPALTGDEAAIAGKAADAALDADATGATVGAVLAGRAHPYESGNAAVMRPVIAALKDAGIGLVSTANNHILDRGPEGLDATLGVPGLPQSGTGHVALLAGVNAPALHGRHQPHFPPVALRPLAARAKPGRFSSNASSN